MSVKPLRLALACIALATATITSTASIEHRKADLTVTIQTNSGTPLEGATVEIEMLNHAFRFGSSVEYRYINPSSNSYDQFTVDTLQRYFNSATYGNIMKWDSPYYEGRTDEGNLAIATLPMSFNAFDGPDNFRLRGHVTVWGARYQVPSRVINSNDGAYISEQILNHVFDYHTTYKDSGVDNYDLYNEHFNERELLIEKIVTSGDVAEEAIEVAKWFNKAKEADPEAVLYINDYNVLNDWNGDDRRVVNYKAFVDAVRDAGGLVDGIGVQGHMDRPTTTKADVTRRLDILAAPMAPTDNHPNGLPGLRLEITELDMAIKNEIHNADWVGWTNATMEQQVAVTRAVLEGSFEHPSVDGITIWGIDDFTHWRGNSIMYDNLAEGSTPVNRIAEPAVLKETGQLWIDKVTDEWWTDENGSSDSSGDYDATVFKGSHKITVTFNGETKEYIQDITEDTTLTVAFAAEAADASTYDSWAAFTEWDGADSSSTADPDNDGQDNFSEFVAGTDPLIYQATTPTYITSGSSNDSLKIRFTQRTMATGLERTLLFSEDLVDWAEYPPVSVPSYEQVYTLVSSEDGIDTFSTNVSLAGYYRLRFSEASQ